MHEVRRFFTAAHGAIKAWGATPAYDEVPDELGLKILARHEAAARNLISQYNIPERFALLAPIARGLHHGKEKQWPHFNALCAPLRAMGIEPIIFPSVREEEANRQACPDATILPPTTLGNYAALAKQAQIVIANDSGISHVAAGVGVKQITLVGVTDVERTSPWNKNAVVLGNAASGWSSLEEVLSSLESALK